MGLEAVKNLVRGRSSAEQTARDALHAAIEARQFAELALQSKEEAVQRLHGIVAAAGEAEQAAAQAKSAAEQMAAAWAHAGAKDDDTAEHEKLIKQAAERQQQAEIARIRATGAAQALPAAQKAKQDAEYACNRARRKIGGAIDGVLIALAEPHLARVEQLRNEYLSAFNRVRSVVSLIYGHQPVWSGLDSLDEKLKALGMPKYVAQVEYSASDSPNFDSDQWVSLIKRLKTDSDAVLGDVNV